MRRISILLAAVLLVSLLGFAPGTVALADAAGCTPVAGGNASFASVELPQAGPNGFIAPIPPRDPNAKPVSTVAQLRAMVNGGNYYLTQDIDLSGYNGGVWRPLMVCVKLDGQGHTIRNLRIPASARQRVAGLFGVVSLNSGDFTVKNLGIQIHADGITAYNALAGNVITEYPVFAGGLVGVADSQGVNHAISFSNCYVTGDVTGTASGANQNVLAGGLAGQLVGSAPISIVNCYTAGRVRSTSDRENSSIGGLAGKLGFLFAPKVNVTVDHCYSSSEVSAMSGNVVKWGVDIGGLVGSLNKGKITNSHAAGAVSAKATNVNIGGLVGTSDEASVIHCSASGKVSASTSASVDNGICIIAAGGLVGLARCTAMSTVIAGCFSTGAVDAVATNNSPTGVSTNARAGGIIGELQVGAISDCYATGAVSAAVTGVIGCYADAGGLAGSMIHGAAASNCYAMGLVGAKKTLGTAGEKGSAGGVAGGTYKSSTIANCYFDSQTAGQAQAIGNDGAAAPDAGKTTAQMKAQATYSGWNFTSVWGINSDHNNGYPRLRWQYVYRVSFNSQGGSAVAGVAVQSGGMISRPADPTRAGCTFGGWYRQAACTTVWNFATDKVAANTTLFAKWTAAPKCAVTVQTNNTSYGTVSGGGSYYNDKVTKATATATPKAGYRFVRWVEGTTTVSTSYQYSFLVTKARTLKAEFAKIGTPGGLKAASAGYNAIKLTWGAVAGAKEYEVYRAASSAGTYTRIATTAALNYTSTGLTAGTTYYFKIRAKCVAGSMTTYGGYTPAAPAKPVPATPTSVKAASASYSSVKITWSAVAGATKYEVYRATSGTGTYTKLTETISTSYTSAGLTAGKAYYYKVRAYRLVGSAKVYGSYSAVVSAKPVPAAPTGVKAARVSASSVKVSWNTVAGATGYEVYRTTASGGAYTFVKSVSTLNWTNTGLVTGKTYYYKVRAYRVVGGVKVYGGYSAVVSAKP